MNRLTATRAFYECEFDQSSSRMLHDLVQEYEDRTEAYDRTVCSVRNERGIAMPATPQESFLINQNARKVRREIMEKAAGLGLTWEQVKSTMNRRR